MKLYGFYLIYLVKALFSVFSVFRVVSTEEICGLTEQKRILCPSESSGLSLTCPQGHGLDALKAEAYRRLSDAACPTTLDDTACMYSEHTDSLTAELQQNCAGNRSCNNFRVTEDFSPDSCQDQGFNGKLYSVISYVCRPYISKPSSGINEYIGMNEATTVSAKIVNINSISSAPTGTFVKTINTACNIQLPAGASLTIEPKIFEKKPKQDACEQTVVIEDGDKTHRVCGKQDTPIAIDCKQNNQEITVKYATTNPSVSVLFEFELSVPTGYTLDVTCGRALGNDPDDTVGPSGPDDADGPSGQHDADRPISGPSTIKAESGPFIVDELSGRGVAILCIIGAIVIASIIIITVLIRRRKRRNKKYSVYEYQTLMLPEDEQEDLSSITCTSTTQKKSETLLNQPSSSSQTEESSWRVSKVHRTPGFSEED